MNEYNSGTLVVIAEENDNDSYDEYRNMELKVVEVYRSTEDHPYYDEGLQGEGLHELVVNNKDETPVPFLLYHYELDEV
ncbi:hypothetical protein IMZ31_24080 (plasmid) [Pontibacillus sp. ALD_SL1]|uniref:hypothetical protein n=1 Tax=Pontibacillus sp. ALD_SL1 TaxID=2777185 RepID=UPI001A96C159|nr:hypothetical protein [Pontibacillus sp. ALD_SL1]QST02532.1 hypothetical protein IMZ31_24080 [Pontibacillus sp. ALD_SL1]